MSMASGLQFNPTKGKKEDIKYQKKYGWVVFSCILVFILLINIPFLIKSLTIRSDDPTVYYTNLAIQEANLTYEYNELQTNIQNYSEITIITMYVENATLYNATEREMISSEEEAMIENVTQQCN
eukprot:Pgem_evm1s9385